METVDRHISIARRCLAAALVVAVVSLTLSACGHARLVGSWTPEPNDGGMPAVQIRDAGGSYSVRQGAGSWLTAKMVGDVLVVKTRIGSLGVERTTYRLQSDGDHMLLRDYPAPASQSPLTVRYVRVGSE